MTIVCKGKYLVTKLKLQKRDFTSTVVPLNYKTTYYK